MKTNYLEELKTLLNRYQITDQEKEDILADYNDMYDGWISEGMTEDEVEKKLGRPRSIIGDLMQGIKRKPTPRNQRDKYIAVTPFIALVIFFILGLGFNLWAYSWLAFLIIPITAIVLSMDEDREHVTTALSPFAAVIAYFVLGFVYNLWHPGWLVFIIIPVIAIFNSRKEMSFLNLLVALSPFAALTAYTFLGEEGYWVQGWVVFLVIPMIAVLNEKSVLKILIWELLFVVGIVGYLYLGDMYSDYWIGALSFIPIVIYGLINGDIQVGFVDSPKEYKIILVVSAVVFVVFGYFFDLWAYAWIVFLSIPMYAVRTETEPPEQTIALMPFISTIIFMTLGYFFNIWEWAWLAYLLIPVVAIIKSVD